METIQEMVNDLRPWLAVKVLEFVDAGYETITAMDLARYFVTYRWKKNMPANVLEQIYQVNQLSLNDYFDFESIEAQTSTTATLDTIDLEELF